jgi:antitoxin component YwqK of YwqJK toxin-antitoxin module
MRDVMQYNEKLQRHGKWMFYYSDGRVMSTTYYVNGQALGCATMHWDNHNTHEFYAR